jgi:arylsulfatase A-like enzyme
MLRNVLRAVPLVVVIGAVAACGAPGDEVAIEEPAAHRPPNILILSVDTLRSDHLPFYRYHRDTAPNLTRLAAGATVFDRAYSTSSWTVPAVASMLTGVYPAAHGAAHGIIQDGAAVQQERLPDDLPHLAAVLQRAGYRTYAAVANAHVARSHGFARGFDEFSCLGFADAPAVNRTVQRWSTEIRAAQGPVLLWVHYFDPHQPTLAREPWLSEFLPDLSDENRRAVEALTRRDEIWSMIVSGGRAGLDAGLALYDAEIAYADDHIGGLFRMIPELDDYLIVVLSDHGEEFLDHGDLGHGFNLYEETARIPLFVRPPGGGTQHRSSDLVSLVDILPSLAAVAGADLPSIGHGRPVFDGGGAVPVVGERDLVAELSRFRGYEFTALLGPRWKLIVPSDGRAPELYDLADDPGEHRNLVDSGLAAHAAVLRDRLEAQLAGFAADRVEVATGTVDPEALDQLEALGYVQPSDAP